jgi:hypothetical protein
MKGVPAAEVTAHDFVMVRAALVQRLGGANNALVWTRIHFRCADGGQRFIDDRGVAWWRASNDQIGEEVGLTADQVFKATTAMRKLGFLESTEHRLGGNYDRTQSWRAVVTSDDVESVDRRNGDRQSTIRTPSNDDQDGVDRRNVPTSQTQKKREDSARARPLSDDFAITAEMREWARENVPAVDVDKALAEWKDYWQGVGKPMKNWVATWRNGMRKQQAFAERDGWKPRPVTTNATEELLAEQKAAWCKAHGVTVAEWDAREHDVAWREEVMARG